MDFVDDDCTTFTGVAALSWIGDEVEFKGYKVADDGGRMTECWEDYDVDAESSGEEST